MDEVVEDRLEQGVADGDRPHRREFRAVRTMRRPALPCQLPDLGRLRRRFGQRRIGDAKLGAPVRIHEIADQRRTGGNVDHRGRLGIDRGGGDGADQVLHLGPHRRFLRIVEEAGLAKRGGMDGDRVVRAPRLDLLARPVGIGVGRGVAGDAVGLDVEEGRALAFGEQRPLPGDGVGNGERVGPVDGLGMEVGRADADADP